MTDIEQALAEALEQVYSGPHSEWLPAEMAATEPMQAIARRLNEDESRLENALESAEQSALDYAAAMELNRQLVSKQEAIARVVDAAVHCNHALSAGCTCHPARLLLSTDALRALAKDIGATAYAEGLHDAETNPERDRDAAIGQAAIRWYRDNESIIELEAALAAALGDDE